VPARQRPSRPPQHQRRPALEADAANEHHAARAVAGERSARLPYEQARKYDLSAGGSEARHRGRQPLQGFEQDIGEDQREWSALAKVVPGAAYCLLKR